VRGVGGLFPKQKLGEVNIEVDAIFVISNFSNFFDICSNNFFSICKLVHVKKFHEE
jgi:hypothetical protein